MRARSLLAIAAVALAAPGVASAQDACARVASLASLPNTTIVSAKAMPANDAEKLPAFCEVHAAISPVAGSHIGAIYRLPVNWNGKVLGIGGGGFAGNLDLKAAANGLSRGYAVIQNDMGHESTASLDPTFAIKAPGQPNVEGIIDFGHRATHLATDVGTPAAYDYGPERCSWLTHHVTNWMGDTGFLRHHNSEIRRHNPVGDWMTIEGTVTAIKADTDGTPLVEITQQARQQDGELSATGVALVRLPSRG